MDTATPGTGGAYPMPPMVTGMEQLNRRPRWGWIIAGVVAAVVAVCCVGTAWLALREPARPPRTATLELPAAHGTLSINKDPKMLAPAGRINDAHPRLKDATTVIYEDSADPMKRVLIIAVPLTSADSELDDMMSGAAESVSLSEPEVVPSGRLGGRTICAKAASPVGMNGTTCAWTDPAGSGMGLFFNRPPDESAELLRGIREAGTRD